MLLTESHVWVRNQHGDWHSCPDSTQVSGALNLRRAADILKALWKHPTRSKSLATISGARTNAWLFFSDVKLGLEKEQLKHTSSLFFFGKGFI